ncbi:MAG: hypothetical protein LBC57_02250, partial [Treponema sp.]|nr:hypothetical protein [Treponema sp.]
TGCVFGGSLSAYRYPEAEVVSVAAAREYYVPAKPLDYDSNAVSGGISTRPAAMNGDTAAGNAVSSSGDTVSAAAGSGAVNDRLEKAQPNSPAASFPGIENLPAIEDVLGRLNIQTRLHHSIVIGEESSAAALEIMSRFSADPRWLIYLPPTMSPCKTSSLPEFLEHPAEAFEYYRKAGIARVVCEEKHMGSRAVIVLCRNQETALDRFGVQDGSRGIIYTRTGRHFFDPSETLVNAGATAAATAGTERAILERLGNVLDRSGFWEEFSTGWVCLDTELMPWSAKARSLLLEQYAPTGRAGRDGLAASIAALKQAIQVPPEKSTGLSVSSPVKELPDLPPDAPSVKQPAVLPPESVPSEKQRGGPPVDMNIAAVLEQFEGRRECLGRYTEAYRRYCWTLSSVEDYRIAPFHILATEGKVWNDENHCCHMETIKRYMTGADPLFIATNHIAVDLDNKESVAAATDWWLGLTGSGGEGMVVKPLDFIARRGTELLQPAVKCRGREYLRIIYGPEYTESKKLERLRKRSLTKKRRLALAEFALGQESLERFVRREPLHRLHECVFAVLALENEAVDPRL